VEFLADNLAMALNCIRASHMAGVQKLLVLGSTCIYPKLAKQPMSEDQLLTGELEPTNQWYAIAKIAGIKLCEAYRRQPRLQSLLDHANVLGGRPAPAALNRRDDLNSIRRVGHFRRRTFAERFTAGGLLFAMVF
jgi:nucleoside-diphosphate-sugar epimerase